MKPRTMTSRRQDHYHEGMLLVKMRPSSVRGLLAERTSFTAASLTPGLSVMAAFERAGRIRRIIPLSARESVERVWRPAGALLPTVLTSFAAAALDDPMAGVALVDFDKDEDAEAVQAEIARDPNIDSVSRVPVRYLARRGGARVGIAAAAPPPSSLWNLAQIKWLEARTTNGFQEASDVKVAVLDTGIDKDNPELSDQVKLYEYAYNDLPDIATSDRDIIGHGTHVAGTVAARINNNLGINGICHCQLCIWKIFDDEPDFDPFASQFEYYVDPVLYRRALEGCLREKVNVINLSIGGGGQPDFVERDLFDRLMAQGTVVVAAMGNEANAFSSGIISYPAAIPGVVAVGATDRLDRRASFSNYRGNHIALCAPGMGIWSTLPRYPGQTGFGAIQGPNGQPILGQPMSRETDYDAWQGTSMACPHVAGAAALLIANRGSANGTTVMERLQQTADKVPNMNGAAQSPEFGSGRLNLQRLLWE